MYTGPEVQGSRPTLVTYESFKDREDVLKNSRAMKGTHISVTEDLSKRTRESRQELRKFMRHVKRNNPERFVGWISTVHLLKSCLFLCARYCYLQYDKLFIDHKIYVYSDVEGKVVEQGGVSGSIAILAGRKQ